MVHRKDDIKKNLAIDTNLDEEKIYDEDGIIQPEWTIDEDGIPYCKHQTDYDKIIQTNLKKRFPIEFEKMLNCKHCDHYKNDNCFFPKSEVDKIENDRLKLKIRCQLCGMKIDRPFSILMSLYYKEKHHVNMPVICCTCYAGLEHGTFEKNSKRRMILFAISLFTSIYFLFTYFISITSFTWWGILLYILPFSFWGYITVRDLRNIYYLHKGRKYYDEIMNATSKEKEISRRDEELDEEDIKKPPKGAYDSSGYSE
ncbi:hypothetical protein NEF87_000066 [Candidatus Lokiarchaeum ossiferum]|uniref:Uncharacterized protein n=1 Tax=Candidatus Lokiarchaeum ossiferum TaxID=2951803 RepID=A0ABY6HJS4_9ARCH|nr:hypothetical protein NEF87_000066 [Candidatus Lokiarchaeum sp. B-35]